MAIWTLATAAETDFPIASRSAGLTLGWLYGPCSLRISQAHNREFIAVLRKAPISAAEVSQTQYKHALLVQPVWAYDLNAAS